MYGCINNYYTALEWLALKVCYTIPMDRRVTNATTKVFDEFHKEFQLTETISDKNKLLQISYKLYA